MQTEVYEKNINDYTWLFGLLSGIKAETSAIDFADWSSLMWHETFFRAQTHGIAPLLYKSFAEVGMLEEIDPRFSAYIEEQYDLNTRRINKISTILKAILEKAGQLAIPVMPLKGAILINDFYTDPGLRPMSDLDLLIVPEDELKITEMLQDSGYHLLSDSFHHLQFCKGEEPVSFNGEHPDNPIIIELHKEVNWPIGPLQFDITKEVWAGAEVGWQGHSSAYCPKLESLLLTLICHASRNMYEGQMRAIQLYDIGLISALMSDSQWSKLLAVISDSGLERIAYTAFTAVKSFTDYDPPEMVLENHKQVVPPALRRQVKNQSLDSLITVNEYKTLFLRLTGKGANKLPVSIAIYEYILNQVRYSMQLRWFFPGREMLMAIAILLKPSEGKKNKWGPFFAYLGGWLITPLAQIMLFIAGLRIREKILHYLRASLLRHDYETGQISEESLK